MKKIILMVFLLLTTLGFGQAPNISYLSPQIYTVGSTISPLTPINIGGAVPATIYGKVTTFAGTGIQGSNDGEGNVASFSAPTGIGLDPAGNVYVSEQGNGKVRKITQEGMVSTLAGNGTVGSANGEGTNASFNNLLGLTVDSFGNIYVSDSYNYRVRKITPLGIVSTFAGNGVQSAVDGSSTTGSFYGANGMASDAAGNVYVSEYGVMKIRKIMPSGTVSTLAGNGSTGAVDGPGSTASFDTPWGMAIDSSGNLYVADVSNKKIRKITTAGQVSTFAGSGTLASTDGIGPLASFYLPYGLAFDAIGNLYVSEAFKIRKITPSGVVTTISATAGSPSGGQNALAYDVTGNLYLTGFSHKIFKIALTGYAITPNLPPGLNFDATTGVISGTPTQNTAATSYTISAYNIFGESTTTVIISTSSLGTLSYSLNKLNLSPNPTSTILKFQTQNNATIDKIVITDLTGKKVLEQNIANQANVANLAKGLYVVEAFSGEEKWVSKFVKN